MQKSPVCVSILAMDTVLAIQAINKTFPAPSSWTDILRPAGQRPAPVRALRGVSFSATRGQIVGLLGPNGAGKTTLLKIIATLILPDSGRVCIRGLKIEKDNEVTIKASLGLLTSQERSFYNRLTGEENLGFFASLYNLDRRQARKRIQELCDLFEIDFEKRRFETYSAGMKQRLGLARALLHDPPLLLLDEPFDHIDYATKNELYVQVKDRLARQEGKTVLLATHQIEEARSLCDAFVILKDGAVCACGTIEDLRAQISDPMADLGKIFTETTKAARAAGPHE